MAQTPYDVGVYRSLMSSENMFRSVAAALKTRRCHPTSSMRSEGSKLWGRNLVDELDSVYRAQARFVVMFISAAYVSKGVDERERQSASRAGSKRRPTCFRSGLTTWICLASRPRSLH